MSLIQSRLEDGIATVTLDHYAKRNALGAELIAEVLAAFDRFKTERARVLVLRAANAVKVWSAGHDIDELPLAGIDPLPYSDPLEQLLRGVKAFPAPVIAMVHGSVWGGASDLVMSCDLVFGDQTCTFAITPAKLGVPYNAAGFLNFMSRLPLNVVKEMFFTAEPIAAERALSVGILNALVPAEELEARTYAMAATIVTRSPAAISAFKETLRALSESAAISPSTYEYIQGLRRDIYFGAEYKEGIAAFREKRPAKF